MTEEPRDSGQSPQPRVRPRVRRLLHILAWAAGGFAVVILLALAVLPGMVNSGSLHRYLIGVAKKEATAKLGTNVTLENFTLHVPTLSVDLYGLKVDGAAPYSTPPLLQVKHVRASVRIASIFTGKWYLGGVRIDDPIVWIVEGENGTSNLPTPRPGSGKTHITLFDLAIRHTVIDRGAIYYNDRPHALEADLRDLKMRAAYDTTMHAYDGNLGYRDGHLRYGMRRVIPHSLEASYTVMPEAFELKKATFEIGRSKVLLSGKVEDFTNPTIRASYNATIDTAQAAGLASLSSMAPSGVLRTSGSMQYHRKSGRGILDGLEVEGDATSSSLRLSTAKKQVSLRQLAAHYSLANGNVTLRGLTARALGGQMEARGTMTDISGASHTDVSARLRGISLTHVEQSLLRQEQSTVRMTGRMDASASASWGKTLANLVAHVDTTISGTLSGTHAAREAKALEAADNAASQKAIPVESAIHATYTRDRQRLTLTHSYVRLPQTALTMNGTLSNGHGVAVDLEANNLGELASMAEIFQTSKSSGPLRQLQMAGKASFSGTINGTLLSPHVTGNLSGSHLDFNGTRWNSLRSAIEVSSSGVRLQNAEVRAASGGQVTLDARATLLHWAFDKHGPIAATLEASRVNLADYAKLMKEPMPVTGTVTASLRLHGTAMTLEGSGHIVLADATVYQQPIQTARIDLSGNGNAVRGELLVKVAGGSIKGSATVRPSERTYTVQASSSDLHLGQLQLVKAKKLKCTGMAIISASGQGSFSNPQMNAMVQIPKLVIENSTISGLKLDVNVANKVADATLAASIAQAPIRAKGRIELTGEYPAQVSLDTQPIPLQPLLAAYAPDQAAEMDGKTEIHATLHGPLKQPELLEAHVAIPVLDVAYNKNIQLAAAGPVRLDYRDGVIDVQPAVIQGTDSEIHIQGGFPVTGHAPATLQVTGTVNLKLVRLFNPDLESGGSVKFDIHPETAGNGSAIGGKIQIVNASLGSTNLPVGLQEGNGVLTVTGNRIEVTSFKGTVGGGTVTAQGGISLRPKLGFDLGMTAKNVRILYPRGVREDVGANLRFVGSTTRALLGGSVNIADTSFTPGFDLTSLVNQFSGGVTAPTAPGFAQNVNLNIAVRSTSNLSLVSRTVSVAGSADLLVRGTAAHPAILGRVNVTGGNIIFNGNRFVLSGGTIQFVNPQETRPVVNLTLSTSIQQYDIDIRLNGPVERMHGEYTSNPALPRADIISLLAFGKTTEAGSTNPTPANQAAESLIASQVSSQVTSRISKIAGISQLSINPVLAAGTTQGPPGAVITIRQQVTGNLYITFSTNVASTQSQTIEGEYKLSPRVSISATRDPNGGFAVDTLIKKKW